MFIIRLAKKVKHTFAKQLKAMQPLYISPVRRINGVKLNEKVCAMTFDDGPSNVAPNPPNGYGSLTLSLIDTLEKHNAKGTFDCIGDTSENYPDECGKEGTAMWGGIKYDHYPDFGMDEYAGIRNCPIVVERILAGGHEVSSHSYLHRIFGEKPFVYGKRAYMGNIDDVVKDLERFDNIMITEHLYKVRFSRPPHYVDKIDDNFTSYDALGVLGYQYLGAGPDGGGWLSKPTYEEEVQEMKDAIEKPLLKNENAFCGAIIFQKDGCNMSKRTPVADALDFQLECLDKAGYKVVTASQLLAMAPFSDVAPGEEGFDEALMMLENALCPCYSDNCLHLDKKVTKEEVAMMLFGWEATQTRVEDKASKGHVYKYALEIAKENEVDLDKLVKPTRLETMRAINELFS